jgi:HD domain
VTDASLAALGLPVPDSSFARAARELILDVEEPFLVNHSLRSYAWAAELALHDSLGFDPEILYVSAILHDIGLVPAYDLGGCFETDGAVAAERFALEQGQPADRARAIHDVVELHMAASLPPTATPEDILLEASTGTDVTGYRIEDVRPDSIPAILAAYPRLDFKTRFAAAFVDQAARKPGCRVAEMVRTGKVAAIAAAPFES